MNKELKDFQDILKTDQLAKADNISRAVLERLIIRIDNQGLQIENLKKDLQLLRNNFQRHSHPVSHRSLK